MDALNAAGWRGYLRRGQRSLERRRLQIRLAHGGARRSSRPARDRSPNLPLTVGIRRGHQEAGRRGQEDFEIADPNARQRQQDRHAKFLHACGTGPSAFGRPLARSDALIAGSEQLSRATSVGSIELRRCSLVRQATRRLRPLHEPDAHCMRNRRQTTANAGSTATAPVVEGA